MSPWFELYGAHTAMRTRKEFKRFGPLVRRRLRLLEDGGYCDSGIRSRFTYKKKGRLHEFYFAGDGGEPLLGLCDLDEARLAVLALVDPRKGYVHQFTVQLSGQTPAGAPWTVAIHLEEDLDPGKRDRKGKGAAAHAAFHCHVGPDLDAVPKVRVPLPGVGPAAALDWVFSLVVSAWDPAPWSECP